jgi:hypothetical protein
MSTETEAIVACFDEAWEAVQDERFDFRVVSMSRDELVALINAELPPCLRDTGRIVACDAPFGETNGPGLYAGPKQFYKGKSKAQWKRDTFGGRKR